MQPARRFELGVVLIGMAVALVLLGLAVVALPEPTRPTVERTLTISADGASTFAYSSAVLEVPSGALVHLTIVNYDRTVHATLPGYGNVTGTLDGTMEMGSGGMMGAGSYRSLGPSQVSHTFSIEVAGYHLNVPIPPARTDGTPASVSVQFVAGGLGSVPWMCETGMVGNPEERAHGMMGLLEVT